MRRKKKKAREEVDSALNFGCNVENIVMSDTAC